MLTLGRKWLICWDIDRGYRIVWVIYPVGEGGIGVCRLWKVSRQGLEVGSLGLEEVWFGCYYRVWNCTYSGEVAG